MLSKIGIITGKVGISLVVSGITTLIKKISEKVTRHLKWPHLLIDAQFVPRGFKIYPYDPVYFLEVNTKSLRLKLLNSEAGCYQSSNTRIISINIDVLKPGKHKMVLKELITGQRYKINFWLDDDFCISNDGKPIKDIIVLQK